MTIYDLRRIICVSEWLNDLSGARIHYTLTTEERTIELRYNTLLSELIAISSIESEYELLDGYDLSQWDALNLVIRHEYAKYMESKIDNSDIGKAINKIKEEKDTASTDIFSALGKLINPNHGQDG